MQLRFTAVWVGLLLATAFVVSAVAPAAVPSNLAAVGAGGSGGTGDLPPTGPTGGPSAGDGTDPGGVAAALGVEHFKCYDAAMTKQTGFLPRTVKLVDQFEAISARVVAPNALCNPASKNGEPVQDPTTHLVCYRLQFPNAAAFRPINVTIRNQFGEQHWTVVNRDGLCVPSAKNREGPINPDVDHYKCYKAVVQAGTTPLKVGFVRLDDQFEKVTVRVQMPDSLCNPVSKDGEPIPNPVAHLACYRILEIPFLSVKAFPGRAFVPRNVLVENQFGKAVLLVRRPATLCVPTVKGPPPPPPGFDHFKCYVSVIANGSQPFLPRNVTLVDQFGTWAAVVTNPRDLCNPVSKNGEPVPDPRTHLSCYDTKDIGPQFSPRKVVVQNQFGNATWTLLFPKSLCLPAEKNAEGPIDQGFNHFRCYAAVVANGTPGFQPRTVVLVDEFGNSTAVAFAVDSLCAPVSKNGEPVRDPTYHLACYRIDQAGGFQPREVRVQDQFGLWTWDVLSPDTLCLPSTKTVPGP